MTPHSLKPTTEQPSSGITLTEFHLFPKLPIELRLQIWPMSIIPRIIQVRFTEGRNCLLHKFKSSIPPLLHANSESRKEGLRHYALSLQRGNAMNCFYFNPQIDMIYVAEEPAEGQQFSGFMEHNDCGLWDQVQSLAIGGIIPWDSDFLEFSALRL